MDYRMSGEREREKERKRGREREREQIAFRNAIGVNAHWHFDKI